MPGMLVSIRESTTMELLSISMPHCAIGPSEDTNPKLTITLSTSISCVSLVLIWDKVTLVMNSSPCSSVISEGVITFTLEAISCSTLCSCARNLSRRCTRVTFSAIGSSIRAQSTAESPPPLIRTLRPLNLFRSLTK
ncbi:hypothetical protein D3C80_1716110 [compost metagenome]